MLVNMTNMSSYPNSVLYGTSVSNLHKLQTSNGTKRFGQNYHSLSSFSPHISAPFQSPLAPYP